MQPMQQQPMLKKPVQQYQQQMPMQMPVMQAPMQQYQSNIIDLQDNFDPGFSLSPHEKDMMNAGLTLLNKKEEDK